MVAPRIATPTAGVKGKGFKSRLLSSAEYILYTTLYFSSYLSVERGEGSLGWLLSVRCGREQEMLLLDVILHMVYILL